MNRSLTTGAGCLLLLTVLAGAGCAPLPHPGPYYDETEVVIIYEPVPVPYPVPVEVGHIEPPPPRSSPLTRPGNQKDPRIKTPRGDRTLEPRGHGDVRPPVVAQGGGGRTAQEPGPRRR
jgi:hypothetical protein